MPHSRISGEEIARRGQKLYEQTIRAQVETEENIGKVVAIDIETGAYRIDADPYNPIQAALALLAERPEAALWSERIGYNAVFALDGAELQRTVK